MEAPFFSAWRVNLKIPLLTVLEHEYILFYLICKNFTAENNSKGHEWVQNKNVEVNIEPKHMPLNSNIGLFIILTLTT